MNASLDAALDAFPGALPIPEFLDEVSAELAPKGFTLEHTFAVVSTCRDELTIPLMRAVTDRLDLAFYLGALGGVPSLGRTGWNAALSHVPTHAGRGHLVVLGMTHIGFGPDGTPGESRRRHQDHATPTCGALMSILHSEGTAEAMPDALDDNEKDRLRHLMKKVSMERSGTPIGITRRAAQAVTAEMWAELDALEAWRTMDVAAYCGVQVHVQDHQDLIAVTDAQFVGADGVRRSLLP